MQRTACNFSIPLKSVLAPFLPLRPCGRVEEPSEHVLNSDTNEEPRVSNPDSKKWCFVVSLRVLERDIKLIW